MKKLWMVVLVGVLALALGVSGALAAPFQPDFTAQLDGASEVPPVATQATGVAAFDLQGSGQNRSILYRLGARNIDHVFAAHIHVGCVGENGPIVVTLFSGGPTGPVRGNFASGEITSSDLEGPLAGRNLGALIRRMNDGCTYVNVHTTEFPGGEIRGQIEHVMGPT